MLYDITSRESFSSVAGWMESVKEHGSSNICIAIVGHKVDLEDERTLTTEEGKKVGFCQLMRTPFKITFLCSWQKTTTVCFLRPVLKTTSTAAR